MGAAALPLVVRPVRGESPLSLLMRLADVNGVPIGTVLHDVGVLNGDDAHWRKLARRLSLDVSVLEPLRQRNAGIGIARAAITFLGHAIRPQFLVKNRVRICPGCIGERGFLKDVWRLVHCVACSDHRTLLIDTCRCGRPFAPTTHGTHPFTCPCGLDLADNVAPAASPDAIAGADWLLQAFGGPATSRVPRLWLIKGGRLGMPFSTMEPHDVMCVIDMIGQAVTVPAHEDEPRTTARRWQAGTLAGRRDLEASIRQVEAAMVVLHDWPVAYDRLLADVAGRHDWLGCKTPGTLFSTRIGQFMLTPYRGIDGKPIEPLQEAVDAFLQRRGFAVRQKVPLRVSATASAIHGVMSCHEVGRRVRVGGRSAMLARVYRETVEVFDARGDEYDDADALGHAVLAEIRRRIAQGDEQISPGEAAKIIGHVSMETRPDIWIHPRLLRTVEPDRTVSAKIRTQAFLRSEVEAMRARIEALPEKVEPNAVPDGYARFAVATKANVGDTYTGQDLLIDLLDGAVPTMATIPNPGLSELLIHTGSVRQRAIARRITRIIETDQFAASGRCEQVLSMLWPTRAEKLDIPFNRAMREAGSVRFEKRGNTTEDRSRPLYWYSLVDHMERARSLFGPSPVSGIDHMLTTPAPSSRDASKP